MPSSEELAALEREVISCRRCPRLVAWREKVAREKRAAYSGDFLFAALHRQGFADRPVSRGRDDGLVLRNA